MPTRFDGAHGQLYMGAWRAGDTDGFDTGDCQCFAQRGTTVSDSKGGRRFLILEGVSTDQRHHVETGGAQRRNHHSTTEGPANYRNPDHLTGS
jgi:hypothetical protein